MTEKSILEKPIIYESRWWEDIYTKWCEGHGPKPPKHPDPDCIWNIPGKELEFDLVKYKN